MAKLVQPAAANLPGLVPVALKQRSLLRKKSIKQIYGRKDVQNDNICKPPPAVLASARISRRRKWSGSLFTICNIVRKKPDELPRIANLFHYGLCHLLSGAANVCRPGRIRFLGHHVDDVRHHGSGACKSMGIAGLGSVKNSAAGRVRAKRTGMKFPAMPVAGLTLFVWMLAGAAQAQTATYSNAELLAALESSYWIAASGPHPKKVYVLAAPWCPVCRQLHKTLSQQSPDIEYRFILTAPRSQSDRAKIGHAAFSRAPAALDEVYGRGADAQGPGTPAEAYADGLNDALWTAINPSLQARSAQPIGLPVLVFSSAGRLRMIAGMPSASGLAALSSSVDAANAPSNPSARLESLLAAPPKLTPVRAKIAYARRDGAALRVAPDPAAAKLAQVKAGVGFMAKAVTEQDGERWYAFQYVADGPPAAFGKASDFR
jgi:hypothetical protein